MILSSDNIIRTSQKEEQEEEEEFELTSRGYIIKPQKADQFQTQNLQKGQSMKVLEKPGKIKPSKKDDIGEQNNYEEHKIIESSSFRQAENFDDVDEETASTNEFNLMIQNVELNKAYQYKQSKEFAFTNDLNQWINDNILFWDIENKPIKFYLPESTFGLNGGQHKITPSQILYKQNSLFQMNSLLNSNDTKNSRSKSNDESKKDDTAQIMIQLEKQEPYDPLNRKQLREIWNNGIFTVLLGFGEPSIWVVRPWVFYSKRRSYQFLKDTFECAKFQFKQIKRRFFTMEIVELIIHNRKNQLVNSENCQCACLDMNILEGLRVIIGIPIHLIILLIGIPLFNIDYMKLKNESNKLIQSRIENEIKGHNRNKYLDISFLNYLINNKQTFLSADFNFQEDIELLALAKQIQDGSLQMVTSEEDKEFVKIDLQEKLYDSLFKRIEKYFTNKHDMNPEVIKSLENTYRTYISMNKHINCQMVNSRNYGRPESVLKDLKRQKCDKLYELAHLFIQEMKKGITIFDEMNIKNKIKEVSKINRLQFTYYKPRVIREQKDNGQITYSAQWVKELQVSTSFYFWKIFFFFAASYFMIHKFMNSCLYFALYSPCGLKAALYPNQFATNFLVDPHTGKIEDDPDSMEDTVTRMYADIKNKARQNVENFENEPDHGLLGKSITRICNRLENWVLRYFIFGFILINIFLRILFLLIGIISLILVPLSLIIAPIYTALCVIVCLLCMDFTVPNNHQSWDLPVFSPLLDLLVWRLFVRGLGQILLSILMVFFHVVFGVFLIVFGFIIYFFRRLLDLIVFIFIASCGRIPGGDSFLAWRISRQNRAGGSNNSNYYESNAVGRRTNNSNDQVIDQLSLDQLQQLIDGEFYKEVLELYKIQMNQKITQPVLANDGKIKQLVQYLPFDFTKNKVTQLYYSSAEKLKTELAEQISLRKKQLPILQRKGMTNYKYKHEDILSIFYSLQSYIKEKYGSKPFFQKFMWTTFKQDPNNYTNLTLHFLNQFFFDGKCQMNQVIEKLTLKEQKNSSHIRQQLDDFLQAKYKTNGKHIEAPLFITFSQFIEKALKRLDPTQPLISMRTDDFMRNEDFMLLNVHHLQGDLNFVA